MSFLRQFDSALFITSLLNKVTVFCSRVRGEILIYQQRWGWFKARRVSKAWMHDLWLSIMQQFTLPQSFPITQPGCWQLFHHDFCNDGFAWQETTPSAVTEKLSASLQEAWYSLELLVTLVVLQKILKTKSFSSLQAQVQKVH